MNLVFEIRNITLPNDKWIENSENKVNVASTMNVSFVDNDKGLITTYLENFEALSGPDFYGNYSLQNSVRVSQYLQSDSIIFDGETYTTDIKYMGISGADYSYYFTNNTDLSKKSAIVQFTYFANHG